MDSHLYLPPPLSGAEPMPRPKSGPTADGWRRHGTHRDIALYSSTSRSAAGAQTCMFTDAGGAAALLNTPDYLRQSGRSRTLFSSSSRGLELREHKAGLILRLQYPYLRITHLALGNWNDELDEDVLPFRERRRLIYLPPPHSRARDCARGLRRTARHRPRFPGRCKGTVPILTLK
ncbi:hypothetical protein GALMADRAFT_147057 [Galerina marginata CBS 339.88]|uniref:Uncharacterized protein n=1 Tax=Galerina marginata (strain CBS 339.88) TaxID=685588 RepID=A0A067SL83_GALM3|nr:hypothetical protein GALMADRAFT_147057 [Galerina marginata CBS 339.88]